MSRSGSGRAPGEIPEDLLIFPRENGGSGNQGTSPER
jgi:hypothetical protein